MADSQIPRAYKIGKHSPRAWVPPTFLCRASATGCAHSYANCATIRERRGSTVSSIKLEKFTVPRRADEAGEFMTKRALPHRRKRCGR
jgi:hypothetical protein